LYRESSSRKILTAATEIRPLDEKMLTMLRTTRDVDGYIELSWRHKTLFYVSSEELPDHEIILGSEVINTAKRRDKSTRFRRAGVFRSRLKMLCS
jgi:hypothetical protein